MTTALEEAAAEVPVVAQAAVADAGIAPARWGSRPASAAVLGPLPCISCGQPVSWWKVGGLLRLMQGKSPRTRHVCPAR